jgi:hypothetical protein
VLQKDVLGLPHNASPSKHGVECIAHKQLLLLLLLWQLLLSVHLLRLGGTFLQHRLALDLHLGLLGL